MYEEVYATTINDLKLRNDAPGYQMKIKNFRNIYEKYFWAGFAMKLYEEVETVGSNLT
jgi:hypothetical protein